jgi:alcohol dehydrogenase (cytochrome c)
MTNINVSTKWWIICGIIGIGTLFVFQSSSHAQTPNAIVTFTSAQAKLGEPAYMKSCAGCHGEHLDDGQWGPPVAGPSFSNRWAGKSVEILFTYTRDTMPPASPRQLSYETYSQILAYMLQVGGMQAGGKELPSDVNALKELRLPGTPTAISEEKASANTPVLPRVPTGPPGTLSPLAPPPPLGPSRPNPLDKLTPVTDALLQNPPASEWLTWRRTYDDHGFSPLKQINRSNVANLRAAWGWSLLAGPNEATPLEYAGVLFVHSYGDYVQALDAVTGDLLWQYSRQLPEDLSNATSTLVKRNLAIYGNKLLVPTSDAHMVALDIKTGRVVWDQAVADYKQRNNITGGPLVAKGKVIIGTQGRVLGGQEIVALDANTGEQAWRFRTIAQPGQPGGDSWNGLPYEKRNGASVWTAGSYDPALNLAYFGPGNTYDTGPLVHPVNQPGITSDALYTDTTLAFNPDTGKLVWYFQHTPNDQWDFDWAFERQVITLPVDGVMRKLVVTAGKEAIFDALDAATGKYVFSMDLGLQNVVKAIDPKTGAKTYNPETIPGEGKPLFVCPHSGGAKNWNAGSYNSETKILYNSLNESCMDLIPVGPGERAPFSSGYRWPIRARPDSDGKFGRIEAINLETRKVVWTQRQRAPQTNPLLATAGGIVFAGSQDRFLTAYDDSTGKVLWKTRLNDVPNSSPITYEVNGKQYLAVVVGGGGNLTTTFSLMVPELQNPNGRGAAIWVFELPDK